jgi:hypothetical protein
MVESRCNNDFSSNNDFGNMPDFWFDLVGYQLDSYSRAIWTGGARHRCSHILYMADLPTASICRHWRWNARCRSLPLKNRRMARFQLVSGDFFVSASEAHSRKTIINRKTP